MAMDRLENAATRGVVSAADADRLRRFEQADRAVGVRTRRADEGSAHVKGKTAAPADLQRTRDSP